MIVYDVGRVCMKVAGREAGKYCVVVEPTKGKKGDSSFVVVTGPKPLTEVKRRRCNIDHLKATEYKVDIKEGDGDEKVIAAYEKAGLVKKLNLKKPSAAELKAHAEKQKPDQKYPKKGKGKNKKKKSEKPEKKK